MSKQSAMVECYVALGSNLGDSCDYLDKAVHALQLRPTIKKLKTSKTYQSKPHGPQDQPDYFNAVVKFETSLEAEVLLDTLQKIENDNKRVRKGVVRWGARTLDLDLLFYGDETINTKRLTVPHPRICERAFVLLPLHDLGADLKTLGKTTIKECMDGLSVIELNNIKRY
jgi:2-amino-4-hydroxy-6-hydroxymethyldihydropteridine diphosphokinase